MTAKKTPKPEPLPPSTHVAVPNETWNRLVAFLNAPTREELLAELARGRIDLALTPPA